MKAFRSGHAVQQAHYRSVQPRLGYRARKLEDMVLLQSLGQADRELGSVAGVSAASAPTLIVNPERLGILHEATGGER